MRKRPSVDANIKMNQRLEFYDKDFKVVVIKKPSTIKLSKQWEISKNSRIEPTDIIALKKYVTATKNSAWVAEWKCQRTESMIWRTK